MYQLRINYEGGQKHSFVDFCFMLCNYFLKAEITTDFTQHIIRIYSQINFDLDVIHKELEDRYKIKLARKIVKRRRDNFVQ